jgi:hypothetical protein
MPKGVDLVMARSTRAGDRRNNKVVALVEQNGPACQRRVGGFRPRGGRIRTCGVNEAALRVDRKAMPCWPAMGARGCTKLLGGVCPMILESNFIMIASRMARQGHYSGQSGLSNALFWEGGSGRINLRRAILRITILHARMWCTLVLTVLLLPVKY